MKKISFLFALLWVSSVICAGNLNGNFNTNEFPTVRFAWHENNPNVLGSSAFKLTENKTSLDFDVEVADSRHPQGENAYVILWEDMAVYNQYHHFYDFTNQVLDLYFGCTLLDKDDYFYIAAYNRTKTQDNTLRPIVSGFTNDGQELQQAVKNYQRSKLTFNEAPNQSDAFPALNEALDLLNARNNDGAKAIFIFTVGRALENSASNSVVSVQRRAQELHIPVYVIQYAAPYGKSEKFEDLAVGSYGMFLSVSSANVDENVTNGLAGFREMVRKVEKRYYGHDYIFTYQTLTERGGDAATLTINVAGTETQLQMVPPAHNVLSWMKTHLILTILCIVLFIALLVVGIVLFVTRSHKHDAQMNVLRQEQESAAQQATAAQQALETYKQETRQQEVARKNDELQKQLIALMHSKNLYPRLFVSEKGNNSVYEMTKPSITIGRKSDNDLVLTNAAVSRNHAQIVFNGVEFVLEDLHSTNGLFVNGQIVKGMHTLKNQDMINIGQAMITFKL